MFAQVVSFKPKPYTVDEMRKLTEQRILPTSRERSGFHALYLMEVNDTEITAFTIWNSRGEAEGGRSDVEEPIQATVGYLGRGV